MLIKNLNNPSVIKGVLFVAKQKDLKANQKKKKNKNVIFGWSEFLIPFLL